MLRLSDFGITPEKITVLTVGGVIFCFITAAVAVLIACLFGIGLYRKAESRGEKKPFFAFLPVLRYYTLGRMCPGSEKIKKISACLLPSLVIAAFCSAVICGAIMFKASAALIFAAEETSGAIKLSSLVYFPYNYAIAAAIITDILALAVRILGGICVYGAFKETGKKQLAYGILSFLITPLAAVLLYVTTKPAKAEGKAEEKVEETAEQE
ncbi:MAG: hypothetical protein IKZ47_06105 [Clostridia bacterium]|nr:hypothetical protein [Clostridia bacterium]